MHLHANAALGIAGRRRLCVLIQEGSSIRAAARRMGVAPATAHRWWHRWRNATPRERARSDCLHDRSSRPHHTPRRVTDEVEARILAARASTNLGPGRLAHLCQAPPSTIWKVLHRHGLSRRRRAPQPVGRRYEWAEPGALIHLDTARLARFTQPGHKTRGRHVAAHANEGLGYVYLHVAIDDHSRYAYVEQHTDERATTCARFLHRALTHFKDLGMPCQAVMTDGARAYRTAHVFHDTLTTWGARHILTPPYTPRWNGKAERFIQTLKQEWAYAHEWPDSQTRANALHSYIRTYNRRRLHSGIGNRPPISRVPNLHE